MATRRRKKIWTWLILGLLVALAAWLMLRPKAVSMDVAPVTRGSMTETVEEEGETRIHDHFIISAPVAGRLLRIELDAGDSVAKGEIVARILPAPLEARQRAELTAQLKAAEAARREAAALVERARSEHDQTLRDRTRAEHLAASGIISRAALEQAQSAEASSAKALEAARNRLDVATSEQAAARARLLEAEQAGKSSSFIPVESPLKGKVLRVLQQSERVVTPGTPLLDVGFSPQLEVVTDVLSTEAVKVHAGDPVLIEGWGGSKSLRGRVRLVEPSGFTKISALGIEEQRVNVVIDFVDSPGALGDGYRVEAKIVVWRAEDVVKLPTSALFRHGDSWAVFVVENDQARLRQVQIGHRNASAAETLSGVSVGERVILHPTSEIQQGTLVKAIPQAP